MPQFGYGKPMTSEQIRHYHEVRKARKEQGLPVLTDQAKWDRRADENNKVGTTNRFGVEEVEGSEHPLLGMRLHDTEEDRTVVVDSVSNCWLDGFYIQMAIREEETNSHGLIFWENINSENEDILKGIEAARDRYKKIE
jgi:hypothetical protein